MDRGSGRGDRGTGRGTGGQVGGQGGQVEGQVGTGGKTGGWVVYVHNGVLPLTIPSWLFSVPSISDTTSLIFGPAFSSVSGTSSSSSS